MKKIITSVVLIALSFGINAQEKIQTEIGLKNDFTYKNGNVGIGTTNPTRILELKDGEPYLRFNPTTNATPYLLGSGDGKFYFTPEATFTATMTLDAGKVGIGTTTPGARLDVKGEAFVNNGTQGVKLTYSVGDNSGIIDTYGNHKLAFRVNNSNKMLINTNGNVGIGTTTPDSKLSVNGKIHAKEVKVDLTGWPDYVFAKEYQLPTLKEVEKHINQKGHLSNIPNAKEVAENGILLGEMNSKLLQKIEELTLYAIQQQKAIEAENKKNKNLEKRIATLETLIKSKIE
jgi:hypothetical protein